MGVASEDPWQLQHPHDALFRAAFSEPTRAAELVRSVLSSAAVACIDWTSLQRIDATFLDPGLHEHQADLLFSARVHGTEVLLYLLYEHKSVEDPWLLLQLWRYVLRIYEHFRSEQPTAEQLPAVVPFVLYHGAGRWRAPLTLRDLIRTAPLSPDLVALQPQLGVVLDDLGASAPSDLHRRRLSVATLLPLLHLQQVRRHRRASRLVASWRRLYRRLQRVLGSGQLYQQLVAYVVAASDEDLMTLRDAFTKVGRPAEEVVMSCAMRIRQQALEEGLQQGMEQGMRQGVQQGMQQGLRQGVRQGMQRGLLQGRHEGVLHGQFELLRGQLEERFGALPVDVEARLQRGEPEDFVRWSRAVLRAADLDAVFRA